MIVRVEVKVNLLLCSLLAFQFIAEAAKEEHKCLVRLLTMALGTDEKKAETLLKVAPTNAGLAPEDHY
jgi:hypothetical protein